MREIENNSIYSHKHKKRFDLTLNFIQKLNLKGDRILDIGPANPFSEILKDNGFKVTNTGKTQDLDLDFEIVKSDDFDIVTAFEIFEHMVSPFPLLKSIKANQLIASVPLRLWFSTAYWSNSDPYDCHYHEFEPRQFDLLLKKAGWEIIQSEKWKGFSKMNGIRPILRRFTDRYYIVYAKRAI
jgi:hypothetical protein